MGAMTPDRRPPLPGVFGRFVAAVYRREIGRRNRAFDRGAGVVRLDRPVISVGNLSVGGTGKTPMVMRVVDVLLDAGRRPCIAMRGYKAVDGVSDEAEEYRSRLEGVPVVAQGDRVAGLRELLTRDGDIDVVVLDDGFQHRRIARDLDIVLVDATRDPFEDRLLPSGWLREPVASLGRAQVVVITHAECVDGQRIQAMAGRVRDVTPGAAIAVARHAWAGFVDERGREAAALGRALVVCAIGHPAPFLMQAREHVEVVKEIVLRDHDPYEPATIERIRREGVGLDLILTTGKDWAKLSRAGGWACPVVRPVLEMSFDRGWEELRGRVLGAAEQAASIA